MIPVKTSPKKASGSPKKGYSPKKRPGSPLKTDLVNDPLLNRAVARGMYYDEMVNVVRPGSPKKNVRYGGMNLFTSKGIPELSQTLIVDNDGHASMHMPVYSSPRKNTWGVIDFELGDSPSTIKDKNMRKKTEAVQREFDKLVEEMASRRASNSPLKMVKNGVVEDVLEGYYMPGREMKHKSPTKRLIEQKNSITEHKKRISKGLIRGDYS